MNDLANAIAPRRPARRRRSPRFLARVEALDARQLLAAGVSGQVFDLMGVAGQSLASTRGTPPGAEVLLLRLTADGTLSAAGVVASVDYGDGSPAQAAAVTTDRKIIGTTGDDLLVRAPDHTYAAPGDYAITVAVVEPGDVAPTLFTSRAIMRAPALPLTVGIVDAANLSGGLTLGSFTADRTPTFAGTTAPGVTVVVTVIPNRGASQGSDQVLTAVADASGRWQVTSAPLADGPYNFSASATGPYGSAATDGLSSSGRPSYLFTVDTLAPKITDFRITDARKGTFSITYSKRDGTFGVLDPAAYVVRRASPALPKGQAVAATDLLNQTAANLARSLLTSIISSYRNDPIEVTGRIRVGKKASLPNGTYTQTVPSALVTSAAGVPLDGEFAGALPTGDGAAGGDFSVKFTIRNGKASKVRPVTPARPAGRRA